MRSLETSTTQMREMNPTKAMDSANNHPVETNIDKVKAFGQTLTPVTRRSGNGEMMAMRYDCNYCGQSHLNKRNSCPAWGKICAFCKGTRRQVSGQLKRKMILLQLILMKDG